MSDGTSDEGVAVVTGGRVGIGKAIARAFLASDEAPFVTGANYRADGGSVASVDL